VDITQLLAFSVKNKASDLHLSAGLPPMIRVHGDVRRINVEALDHKQVHAMVYDIMNDGQRKHYEEFLEIDFSFELTDWRAFGSTPSTTTAAPARCSGPFRARFCRWNNSTRPRSLAIWPSNPAAWCW
jgi:Tfp pilus assembly pilus retraction ATPase PilT